MASGGAVMRNAALHSPWRRLGAPLLLSTALALGGCAALGGNVRGDFSCAAPDGVCAPSATIDDRALAMITADRSEEHTSELQSLMRISYAVFCLKKKKSTY